MPHPLVLALFQDRPTAAHAARLLRSLGLEREDLSLVASTHELEGELADQMEATPGVELEDSWAAARLGEIGGHLVAAIAIVLPGIGPIVTAGPLSAEFGEAAGHLGGHIAAVLRSAGLSEERAAYWQTAIAGGALLLGAHVRRGTPDRIEAAMAEAGATEVALAEWE